MVNTYILLKQLVIKMKNFQKEKQDFIREEVNQITSDNIASISKFYGDKRC